MKRYELSNHLGNVLAVITDRKLQVCVSDNVVYYQAQVVSISDYDPFGMLVQERVYTAKEYRFGFQGQEKDDEIKGRGRSINYMYRMHDARIGRFFAVDPICNQFPWNSPYVFSENKIIEFAEFEGLQNRPAASNSPRISPTYYKRSQTTKIKAQTQSEIRKENYRKEEQVHRRTSPPQQPIVANPPHEGGQSSSNNKDKVIVDASVEIIVNFMDVYKKLSIPTSSLKQVTTENTWTNEKKNNVIAFIDLTDPYLRELQALQQSWDVQFTNFLASQGIFPPKFPSANEISKDATKLSNYNKEFAIYVGRKMIAEMKFKETNPSPIDQLQQKGNEIFKQATSDGNTESNNERETVPTISPSPKAP